MYRQLGLAGASPHLAVGMGREADALVGHVWVVVDGKPVLEPEDPSGKLGVVVTYDADGRRSGGPGPA